MVARATYWFGLGLSLLAIPAAAGAEDFCADRPGLATGACLVPPGHIQLETSLAAWSLDRSAGVRSTELAVASSVLRIGIANGFELQAAIDPLIIQSVRAGAMRSRDSAIGDGTLGLKVRLTSASSETLAIALLPIVKLPLAKAPIGNGKVEAGLLAPIDFALSERWSLTLTPEADWLADTDGRGRHAGYALAGSLGVALGEAWTAALDVGWSIDRDPAGSSRAAAAGLSLAWMARDNLQLDVEVDVGLNQGTPDRVVAIGFAYRPRRN